MGWPGWIGTDRWDLDAEADGHPSRETVRAMLQNLLAERFHAAVHRESRELPRYALTAPKPRMALRKVDGRDCGDRRAPGLRRDTVRPGGNQLREPRVFGAGARVDADDRADGGG